MSRLSNRDGIDHINIYSKGKTQLGKMLSNMYELSFTHPIYGKFPSVESFWYFNKFRRMNVGDQILFEFRKLSGFEAKKRARQLDPEIDNGDKFNGQSRYFKQEIQKGLRLKVIQNDALKRSFVLSKLPFKHYYVFFEENDYEPEEYQWIPKYFESLRDELQGK